MTEPLQVRINERQYPTETPDGVFVTRTVSVEIKNRRTGRWQILDSRWENRQAAHAWAESRIQTDKTITHVITHFDLGGHYVRQESVPTD